MSQCPAWTRAMEVRTTRQESFMMVWLEIVASACWLHSSPHGCDQLPLKCSYRDGTSGELGWAGSLPGDLSRCARLLPCRDDQPGLLCVEANCIASKLALLTERFAPRPFPLAPSWGHGVRLDVTVCACGVNPRHRALGPQARPVCSTMPHAQKLNRKLVGTVLGGVLALGRLGCGPQPPKRVHCVWREPGE